MPAQHLKLYCGPTEVNAPVFSKDVEGNSNVTLSLQEVLPLLADAVNSSRTWLSDFSEDDITISADLYEVLHAYQHFCRPSA